MKNTILSLLVAVGLIGIISKAEAQIYSFKIFSHPSYPNASFSGLSGSDFYGIYGESDLNNFIYDGSNWTTINAPNSTLTRISGISGNTIVGYYRDNTEIPTDHGFIYDGVNWTTPNAPNIRVTEIDGISGNTVVGSYMDNNANHFNFIYDGSKWTSLNPPDPTSFIQLTGISGNTVVGSSYGAYSLNGVIYDGSNWTTITAPNSSGTVINGISGNTVYGYYFDSLNMWGIHGFTYDGNNWTTIDYPDALETLITGVSGSTIVGYTGGDSSVSFIATLIPEPSTYALFGIGAIGLLMVMRRKKTA